MSTINRRIIDKIKALRAKTTDAGATEAEAASAAEMAQRLMVQYQIDAGDVTAADYDRYIMPMRGINLNNRSKSHPFTVVADGVAHITGTKVWLSNRGVLICGDEVGREMAAYLFDMVRNVLDASWRRESKVRVDKLDAWLVKNGADKSTRDMRRDRKFRHNLSAAGIATDDRARRSYLLGMGSRIRKRMLAMPPARAIPDDVALRLIADKKMKPDGPKRREPDLDANALVAGHAAGNDVPISMGVGTTAAPLMLGKVSP